MQKRTLARAATALLTASLALGFSPSAEAKPQSTPHASTTTKAADGKAHQLAAAKRATGRTISVTDARLDRAASGSRLAALDAETADVLRAGIASDREQLAALGDQLAVATTLTEVRAVSASVRAVRVEVWAIAVDVLTDAAAAASDVDELTAALDLVADVSPDAYLALDDALVAIDSAVAKALATTAFGGKAELLTAYDDLAAASTSLATAASYLPV